MVTDQDDSLFSSCPLRKLAANLLLLLALVGLSACSFSLYDLRKATYQTDPGVMQRRLYDVGLPLLMAAVEWCPFEQDATYGFFLRSQPVGGAVSSPGTRTVPIVAYVHPRLPAAVAGLALGDRVIEVNTTKVEADGAEAIMQWIHRVTAARIQPLQLEVEQHAVRRTVILWAKLACNFSLRLIESDMINGVSNGRVMAVTTGAMQAFSGDDELAWILAHELAHNILSHAQNAQLRVLLNAFVHATSAGSTLPDQPSPDPRTLEAQADYVGAYLMARAGYDLDAVQRVWERVRQLEERQPTVKRGFSQTHPTTAERLAAFQETFKEIQGKRRRGESLRLQLVPLE